MNVCFIAFLLLICIMLAFVLMLCRQEFGDLNITKGAQFIVGGASLLMSKSDNLLLEEFKNDKIKDEWIRLYKEESKNKNHKLTLTFDDIKHKLQKVYIDKSVLKNHIHDGRQKLFLGELQFLTMCLNSHLDKRVVIYAGALPSKKNLLLLKYFPNLIFILVDPSEIELLDEFGNNIEVIKPRDLTTKLLTQMNDYNSGDCKDGKDNLKSIYFIHDFFTDKLAHQLSAIKNSLFLSDIRTFIIPSHLGISDGDIIYNLSQQWLWMKYIQPEYSWIKFRHPYYYEEGPIERIKLFLNESENKKHFDKVKSELKVDFVKNWKNKKLQYMPGKLYIQAYGPPKTTETRLFVKQSDIAAVYDYGDYRNYSDKFFYFNTLKRSHLKHSNKHTDKSIGLDHCHDCALSTYIWESYIKKYKRTNIKVIPSIKNFIGQFDKPLLRNEHGNLF